MHAQKFIVPCTAIAVQREAIQGGDSAWYWMEQTAARPKNGRPLQDLLPTSHVGFVAAARFLGGHLYGQIESLRDSESGVGSARLNLCKIMRKVFRPLTGISHSEMQETSYGHIGHISCNMYAAGNKAIAME